jgi:release factor glutamine methyltransferase
MATIHARVAEAREQLRFRGISSDEAALDARLLAEFLLGWDSVHFYESATDAEPPGFDTRYAGLISRRASHEPLAYITGRQEFWGLQIEVSPAVLIPRPETELVIEAALDLFPDRSLALSAADACTGSGCLAIALACERPAARVLATDISEPALEVARRNVTRHGVSARVHCEHADLLATSGGPFDLIVSNPPYVPQSHRQTLPPEVRDHEPAVALFAGEDGLEILGRLIAQAVLALAPEGILIVECGMGQSDEVVRLIGDTGNLRLLDIRRDLQGIPRTAVARRVS